MRKIILLFGLVSTFREVISRDFFGSLEYVGNDNTGFFYSRYPMEVCQGDCDTDDDCQEGLYCHQRNSNDAVPHCRGGEKLATAVDFCAWNTDYPRPSPPAVPPENSGVVQLKLFWQEGYRWQNETYDRKWCMISDYDGFPGNGVCHYGNDVLDCNRDHLYIGKCLPHDTRQWFMMEGLGARFSGSEEDPEVMIRTWDGRCVQRQHNAIRLTKNCNPRDQTQRFFAVRGKFDLGDQNNRFELGQYRGYTHESCVTTAHHPKSGEVVEFHNCEAARSKEDETSFLQVVSLENLSKPVESPVESPAESPVEIENKDCMVGQMLYQPGDSMGHFGYACINGTHFEAAESECGEDGNMVYKNVVLSCPRDVPMCVQCGTNHVGQALCVSSAHESVNCFGGSQLVSLSIPAPSLGEDTVPVQATETPPTGCSAGDISYKRGDSFGVKGFACINETYYKWSQSFCGDEGEILERNFVLPCSQGSNCFQCGSLETGEALCLEPTQDIPKFCNERPGLEGEPDRNLPPPKAEERPGRPVEYVPEPSAALGLGLMWAKVVAAISLVMAWDY